MAGRAVQHECKQVTADCMTPTVEVTVVEALGDDSEVQEVFGLNILEVGTFARPG